MYERIIKAVQDPKRVAEVVYLLESAPNLLNFCHSMDSLLSFAILGGMEMVKILIERYKIHNLLNSYPKRITRVFTCVIITNRLDIGRYLLQYLDISVIALDPAVFVRTPEQARFLLYECSLNYSIRPLDMATRDLFDYLIRVAGQDRLVLSPLSKNLKSIL